VKPAQQFFFQDFGQASVCGFPGGPYEKDRELMMSPALVLQTGNRMPGPADPPRPVQFKDLFRYWVERYNTKSYIYIMNKLCTKWFKKLGNDLLAIDVQQLEEFLEKKILFDLEVLK